MPKYILMLRDSGAFPDDITPEEMQEILGRYSAWRVKVNATGQKLTDGEGRVVTRKDHGVSVTDGPYVESKEVIGGFFVIEAGSYEEAIRISDDCPHLDFGSIEIREIER
ncbi:MAG TPA: YciI family protein [Thermoanaerobaculia bacterium]